MLTSVVSFLALVTADTSLPVAALPALKLPRLIPLRQPAPQPTTTERLKALDAAIAKNEACIRSIEADFAGPLAANPQVRQLQLELRELRQEERTERLRELERLRSQRNALRKKTMG